MIRRQKICASTGSPLILRNAPKGSVTAENARNAQILPEFTPF